MPEGTTRDPPASALTRVLAALDRVGSPYRHSGGGYSARCPAHDDRNPSLSLRAGDKGVVMTCQAHCDTRDIVTALGLEMSDLFDESGQQVQSTNGHARPVVVATYDYQAADGTLLYQKLRYFPKDFRIRRPNGAGWAWGMGDVPRVLYRLPEVLAGIAAGRTVWVVEGEADADRLVALGHVATCNFDGASKDEQRPKWRPEYSAVLTGADVVVVADNDSAGRAHARGVESSLDGKAASVVVRWPAVDREHADVSDHLDAGHSLEELLELEPRDGPPEVVEPAEQSLADLYTPIDWHELWSTTTSEPDWLVPGLVERGRLHAIYAPRKHKKSLVTLLMVAELITGRDLFGHPNPHDGPVRVMYVDIENAAEDVRQRLEAAGYGPGELANLVYFSFPSLPALDTAAGGAHLMALVERHKPDLLVLDTTSRVVAGKENESDTFRALYRYALAPIKSTRNTAILRLDHAGKDVTLGQRGSSAKGDDLDTAWVITMPSWNTVTLRLDFQRTNHHPQEIELLQHRDPLRFERLDVASVPPKVARLIAEMDRLGVPMDSGRRPAREALTRAGIKGSEHDLNRAIKIRKSGTEDQRTTTFEDDLQKIGKSGTDLDSWPEIPAAQTGSVPPPYHPYHQSGSGSGGGGTDLPVSRSAPVSGPHHRTVRPGCSEDPRRCVRCDRPAERFILGECPSCAWRRTPVDSPDSGDQGELT